MSVWKRIEAALVDDAPRPTRVRLGPNRGTYLILSRATQTKHWLGLYEREVQRAIAGHAGPAWDIGAHIGFFTLLLAKHAERVLAVEPNPASRARLAEAIRLNDARVTVVDAAVSSGDGTGRLEPGPNSSEFRLSDRGIPVRTVTLDTLMDTYGVPSLVKIDIEGGEVDALLGGRRLLAERPKLIVETHGPRLDERVREILGQYGYRIARADNSLVTT